MVKTANSSDPNNEVSATGYGAAAGKAIPWNIDDSGDLSSEGRAAAVSWGKNAGSYNAREWRIESG